MLFGILRKTNTELMSQVYLGYIQLKEILRANC